MKHILIITGVIMLSAVKVSFGQNLKDSVIDVEGHKYGTCKMWEQTWMADNLDVRHYRNGDTILYAKSRKEWKSCYEKGVGAWCYNYGDEKSKSGITYNWYAATDKRGLAPEGWHIPTKSEIDQLLAHGATGLDRFYMLIEFSYCCMPDHDKKKPLENLGLSLSGVRESNGDYTTSGGYFGAIWSSTFNETWAYGLFIFGTTVDRGDGVLHIDVGNSYSPKENNMRKLIRDPFYNGAKKSEGLSVRCIKD